MNFFEKQDQYKKNSRRFIAMFCVGLLVLTFALYLVVIVSWQPPRLPGEAFEWWNPLCFLYTTLATFVVVGIASLVKRAQLGKGGHSIAQMMGGKKISLDTSDFYEKRALNIVSEMALASGVPVPDVYLLRNENAINAFAAGLNLDNAVIGLTKGAIERLTRSELQGVVGHEFSHILHGDMRINVHMIALLHGVLFIHILGRFFMRGTFYGAGVKRRSGKKSGNTMMIGLALWVIGYLGYIIGKMIQSSVARQREYLADSSAVQYTRNPDGIADALKKIGGFYDARTANSFLYHHHSEEISHMTFAQESFPMVSFGFMESHPPIIKRIQAIDPGWQPPPMSAQESYLSQNNLGQMDQAVLQSLFKQETTPPMQSGFGPGLGMFASLPLPIVLAEQEDWAPLWNRLEELTKHTQKSKVLLYYLLTTGGSTSRVDARAILEKVDPYSLHLWDDLEKWIPETIGAHRIEIFDLCMPALRKLPLSEYKAWIRTLMKLIKADGQIHLDEWLFVKMIQIHLHHHFYPQKKVTQTHQLSDIKQEIRILASAVAHSGERDATLAAMAFKEGMTALGWADLAIMQPEALSMDDIDHAHEKLEKSDHPSRIQFIQACKKIIHRDQKVTWEEYELYRALSDSLGQPVQP